MDTNRAPAKYPRIRPITMTDFPHVLQWSKDPVFCEANEWDIHRDEAELLDWWQCCVTGIASDFVRMGIELDRKLIGYADLANIEDSSAELGIAIGESALWGKGIGYRSSKKMIEYASEQCNIQVLNAETHETNNRSRRMLERLGFSEVSRIGSELYLGVDTPLIQYNLSL